MQAVREPLWTPSEETRNRANITRFLGLVNRKFGAGLQGYAELYAWSTSQIADFWAAVAEFTGMRFSTPWTSVVDDPARMPGAKWFQGARLNFAENLLRFRDARPALVFRREDGLRRSVTHEELYGRVTRLAAALRQMGVRPGDRVAAYMPNAVETAEAMLAATAVGAVWSSCAVDIRPGAVLDRFGQVEPKVLFTVDGYLYKGKRFDCRAEVRAVVEGMPSLQKVVVLPYLDREADINAIPRAVPYDELLAGDWSGDFAFEQLAFDHPLFIMFSSGTTGKPKCMVQGAGGVLVNHLNEVGIHTDLRPDDTIFYITTCSWMMWNWLLSSLGTGAAVLLYDGNPLFPRIDSLWRLIEQEKVTVFGTSASYIEHMRGQGFSPRRGRDLAALRQISQTGSALSAEGFEYVYREIKSDLHFNSISGGTDINGCFTIGNPTLPVYAGETQAPGLGKKIRAYDDRGRSVVDRQGELVCEAAIPSMPLYFWNDQDGDKYRRAYFATYPGIWRHGDYVLFHGDTGGVTFYGRSDSVLMPSGVRIGTAEIYREMEKIDAVEDSLAIGQRYRGDERVLLFVKLRQGHELTAELEDEIRKTLRSNASPRHVPARIIRAPDIPYTLSMKKVESAVANIVNGRPVVNRDALVNPESLDFYRNLKGSVLRS
jgi:acetoacetyl-CoA synthetase